MNRLKIFILTIALSINALAQDCNLNGVDFLNLDLNQVTALESVGASCKVQNNIAILPDYNSSHIKSLCKEKWSKRGVLDQRMYDYCLGQDLDSYKDLQYLISQSSEIPGIGNILEFSIDKWYQSDAWRMVRYEVDKQKEGFLDVEYMMSNGESLEKLNSCKSQWLKLDSPQWDMVRYCLER